MCPWSEDCRSGERAGEAKACERGVTCRRLGRLQAEWERAYCDLTHLKPVHAPLVEQAVQARMVIAYCDRILNLQGFTSEDRYGSAKMHPAFDVRNRYVTSLLKLHKELMLTPKAVLEAGGRLEVPQLSFGEMVAEAEDAEVIDAGYDEQAADDAQGRADQDAAADAGAAEAVSVGLCGVPE